MNIELIKQRKEEIIEQYGDWTAHNIQLCDDIYTIDNRVVGNEIKLRRVIQIVSDVCGSSFENLRILDLACLEGLYAIESAFHGAEVIAIEGRKANLEKARYVKEVFSLNNLELIQDDVRNLSKDKHGIFDIVLCLGILYHLDVSDVFLFMERVAEVCRKFLIIDTHVSMSDKAFYIHNGKKYWGRYYQEHSHDSTSEEIAKRLWASLDNSQSFWFTRPSLYNLLSSVGFTSVYECHNPPELEKPHDRITLLAIKGSHQTLITSPLVKASHEESWPERQPLEVHPSQQKNHIVNGNSRSLLRQLMRKIKKFLQFST